MSDTGSSVGEVFVDIGADWSDLDAGLDQVTAKVDAFGEDIKSALNELDLNGGFSAQLNQLGESVSTAGAAATEASGELQSLGGAAEHLADAAGSAGEALKNEADAASQASHATQEAGHSAEEAAGEYVSMGEAMLGLAEAFAVFEGLKEIATEAIEAAGGIQQFTIAMTALTGSSQKAEESLQNIEKMAATQPFAMADLTSATQRLATFGIEGEQAARVLQDAGNASLGAGKSLDAVVSALGRVSNDAGVSAKMLQQLGLNWNDLAKAAHTSVDQVQADLKKGGEDAARQLDTVLTALEAKFSGLGQKMGQGILGEFRLITSQMHGAMVDLGNAVAPVLETIIDLIRTDLIPALKEGVAAFNALPTSVKETGTIFLGLIGTMAALEGAIRIANAAAGTFATTLKTLPYLALAAAGADLVLSIRNWLNALDDVNASEQTQIATLDKATNFLKAHGVEVDRDALNLNVWRTEVQAGFEALAKGNGTTLEAMAANGRLAEQYKQLQANLAQAKTYLDQVTQAYNAHTASAGQVYAAQQAYNKALTDLNGKLPQYAETFAQLTQKYAEQSNAVKIAQTTLTQAQAAYDAAQKSGVGLAHAQAVLVEAQNNLISAYQKADPLMKSHAAALAEINVQYQQAQMRVAAAKTALDQAQAAYDAAKTAGVGLAQALSVLVTAHEDYTAALKAADPVAKLHVQTLQEMSEAYDLNQLKVTAAKAVLDQAVQSLNAMRAASGDVNDAVQVLNGSIDVTRTRVQSTKTALDAATVSLTAVTAAHGNQAKALALVQQALENYTAALKAANSGAGTHAETLAQLSAEYDKNKLAVEQATQTLNDAISADNGSAKAAELVQMAREKLTAATNTLNQGTKEATASVRDHTQSLNEHHTAIITENSAVHANVQAINDLRIAIGAATSATQTHVQTIQELTNHENALQVATSQAKAALDAARQAYDGSSASLAILIAAQDQYNKLVRESDPLLKQQSSDLEIVAAGYDKVASAAGAAGKAASDFATSASVSMQDIMAMFGGYGKYEQNHPGENGYTKDGMFYGSYITPGTLTPATTSASSPASSSTPSSSSSGTSTAFQNTTGLTGPELIAQAFADAMSQGNTGASFEDAVLTLEKAGYSFQGAIDALNSVARSLNTITTPSGTSVSSTPYGGTTAGAGSSSTTSPGGVTVNVSVQAGVVAGNNGMQQLANMVGSQLVGVLRGSAGLKI